MGVDHIMYSVPTASQLYCDVVSGGLPREKVEMLYNVGLQLRDLAEGRSKSPLTGDYVRAWVDDIARVSPKVVERVTELDRRFAGGRMVAESNTDT